MNKSGSQQPRRSGLQELLATVWPAASATDSELQRRKKLAVRNGHLAMAALVLAAVGGTMIVDFCQLAGAHLAALVATALVYIAWNLWGTRGAVRLLLWEQGAPAASSSRLPGWGAIPYFAVQVGLAGLVFYLGDRGRVPTLVWLALLPPVAYSVFLLQRLGIALVTAATAAVFVFNVVRWHGWQAVPYALLAFSFALLFTLVFTLLAVSSERARGEVQRLAGELGEANRKLREYAVQVEELAAARERNRLAREIHDSLGHYLTVVNVQLEAGRVLGERDPAGARGALDKAQTLTQEGLREIRRSVAALRASPLDNKPLADALREVLEEGRAAGLTTEMEVLGQARALSPQVELTLYRQVHPRRNSVVGATIDREPAGAIAVLRGVEPERSDEDSSGWGRRSHGFHSTTINEFNRLGTQAAAGEQFDFGRGHGPLLLHSSESSLAAS